MDIVVVGAGVIGLTTSLALADAGHLVRLVAEDLPADTTSRNAGAIWGPHLVSDARVAGWALATLPVLTQLADQPCTGVRIADGIEASRNPMQAPEWLRDLKGFRDCKHGELPTGFAVGWHYSVPVIDMPRYLDHLIVELARRGITIETHRVADAAELSRLGPVVVNCTGLGARELAGDDELRPVRGDLIKVANPGITEFFAEHIEEPEDQTYFIPFGEFLLLGGTAMVDDEDRAPRQEVADGILRRCARIEPRLRDARVLEHRVGLRPQRPGIRLERAESGVSTVIHNYGHGGSGVSLSWGCAEAVVGLVAAAA
jgi:D-amino-acid oxidase